MPAKFFQRELGGRVRVAPSRFGGTDIFRHRASGILLRGAFGGILVGVHGQTDVFRQRAREILPAEAALESRATGGTSAIPWGSRR